MKNTNTQYEFKSVEFDEINKTEKVPMDNTKKRNKEKKLVQDNKKNTTENKEVNNKKMKIYQITPHPKSLAFPKMIIK